MALIPAADALRAALVPSGSAFSGGGGFDSIFAAAGIAPLIARLQAEAAAAATRGTPQQPAHVRDLWERLTGGQTTDQALRAGNLFRVPPGFVVQREIPSLGAKIIRNGTEAFLFNERTGAITPPQPSTPAAISAPAPSLGISDYASASPTIASADIERLLAALLANTSGGLGRGGISLEGAARTAVPGPVNQTAAGNLRIIDATDPLVTGSRVAQTFTDGSQRLIAPDGRSFAYDPVTGAFAELYQVPAAGTTPRVTTGAPAGLVPIDQVRQQLIAALRQQQAGDLGAGAETLAAPAGGSATATQQKTPEQIAAEVDDTTLQELISAGFTAAQIASFIPGAGNFLSVDSSSLLSPSIAPFSTGTAAAESALTFGGSDVVSADIPILPAVAAVLGIANAIAGDAPDGIKALLTGGSAVNLIATAATNPAIMGALGLATLPVEFVPGIGQAVQTVLALLTAPGSPGNPMHYYFERRNELAALPTNLRVLADQIMRSTTEEELQAAVSWNGQEFGAVFDPSGRVLIRGVHADLGALEGQLTQFVQRQRQLINATDPQTVALRNAIRADNVKRGVAADTIAQYGADNDNLGDKAGIFRETAVAGFRPTENYLIPVPPPDPKSFIRTFKNEAGNEFGVKEDGTYVNITGQPTSMFAPGDPWTPSRADTTRRLNDIVTQQAIAVHRAGDQPAQVAQLQELEKAYQTLGIPAVSVMDELARVSAPGYDQGFDFARRAAQNPYASESGPADLQRLDIEAALAADPLIGESRGPWFLYAGQNDSPGA